MIRAAIVGIGHWGRTLVNAVQGNSDKIRFAAGYTRTRAKAEAFCAEKSIALYDSLDAILADPAIDAVYFATPHSEHGGQVARTAAAGKHVFMEKPFTLDRNSAAAAIEAVARAGVILGVAYPRRFHPGMVELKSRVASGSLGTIAHCYGEQNTPAGLWMAEGSWRATAQEAPGGAMTALGVHNVDAMIHLFGEIDEVYASSLKRAVAYDAEDTTSVMFAMRNGMSASMVCSLVTTVSYRLAVFGSKGCAELRTPNLDFHFTPIPSERPSGRQVAVPPQITEYAGVNGLLAELEAFADAIEGGPAYPILADQVLHGVAVFEAIIASAARRQPVKVARS
ncbi:MAG TPA: Gfo/Idh/MocA family oxidoreductase [Stellaceae bacterium]|jgi:predicted dehydrogenase|nr:Gfo/Idh/MocA family oxidoreductase [Stellaceae bacterium]